MTTSSSAQLPARSPMPLIVHSTCRAPSSTPARLLATARPRSLWQWTLMTALSMFGTRFVERADDAAHVRRRGVADRVGDVDRRRAGLDRRLDDLGRGSRARCGRRPRARTRRRRSSRPPACTPSTARPTISSLSIFSLNSRWMALVARKTWIRGCSACLSASQARSMSSSLQRARPQIVAPRILCGDRADRLEVAGRGDREAGLDDVDAEVGQRPGDLQLLGQVHARAGRLLAVAQRRVEDSDDARRTLEVLLVVARVGWQIVSGRLPVVSCSQASCCSGGRSSRFACN